eukprot:2203829-Alexandrium_andersonii.AAC.1
MSASLVGSEMCIRDSASPSSRPRTTSMCNSCARHRGTLVCATRKRATSTCLLYTSDAADDM